MPARPDVLIVGAGVVGAAIAYSLSQHGISVELLDASFAAGGATAAGMGHIVVMDDSEAQFALTSRSRALLDTMLDELPASCEYERCGTLWIARDDEELEAARAKLEFYVTRGVEAILLDARELRDAEPYFDARVAGALLVPDDGVLYPPAFAWFLLERAFARGGRLREGAGVDSIGKNGVVSQGLRMDAGLVVNAAGAAAPQLTQGLPILPRKGHLAITDRHPGLCRHQTVELGYLASAHTMSGESVAFNLQPRATGQVLIGSSRELVGWDGSINRSVLRRMVARAIDFVPALADASVIRVWTGFRPATPDKLPLIGRWEESENVWIAAGHEGLGITTALATGELISDLITGGAPVIDPAPFAPGRTAELAEA